MHEKQENGLEEYNTKLIETFNFKVAKFKDIKEIIFSTFLWFLYFIKGSFQILVLG